MGKKSRSKKPLKAPPPPVDPAHIDYKDVPLWRSKSSLRQFQLAMSNKEKDTYQDNVRFLNALKNHEWPLAERLQEEGADMYAKTGERGFNCLHHFAMEKDLQAFSWLMASRKTRGDGPEGLMVTADDGATPLLLACAQGQKTMVELLCSEAGREMMDKPNDTGHTPLYMAVQGNHVNLVTWFERMPAVWDYMCWVALTELCYVFAVLGGKDAKDFMRARFLPAVRATLITLYFSAAFWKLTTSWFDGHYSCSTVLMSELLQIPLLPPYPLPRKAILGAPWLAS